jgi:hypothetical protein
MSLQKTNITILNTIDGKIDDNTNDLNTIDGKIDTVSNTSDNIFEETTEIGTHIHSNERWFEKATIANGELHVADRIGTGIGAFQMDAGNNDWGAWIQILGTNDTPADTGKLYFDGHRAEFVSAERSAEYFVQIVAQNTNPNTGGIDNEENITEFVLKPLSVVFDSGPVEIQNIRVPVTTKTWVRCKCPGQNTGTLDFYFGIHEYDE